MWNGNGDYLGRADNDASQTVRCYNDIEDAGWFYDGGLGGFYSPDFIHLDPTE